MTAVRPTTLTYEASTFTELTLPGGYEDESPPTPPPKDVQIQAPTSPNGVQSYFNPLGLSRTNSIYTLSRVSFSNQLLQLTAIKLPQASSLSSSISSIPTAPAAANALSNAATQIQRWIQKAAEVLGGLDAEDDVEWAAAGGREGLGEVDTAIGKFEGLIGVYVTAIEELQERGDIEKVPVEELKDAVDQMETTLKGWDNVRRLLRGVKQQVELAMEWEELWGVVLGDIGLEMENLTRVVFEMEERRHKAMTGDITNEDGTRLDIQELETIVEESPMGDRNTRNHRFSLPPAFPVSSPLQSPGMAAAQDDSSLLALFARMQPLRASLDFLPMRLSTFQSRAEAVLPTACQELETRRRGLERKWKKLESDAESLRRELGEDRWVLVFRNAGRQAQKMCESIERSINKLQDSIDTGAQHSNPPALAKKIENYEAKKTHYGPAIQRVLAIIEKGIKDRLTVNGEILRLHSDMQGRWTTLEAEIKDTDLALDDLNVNKNQQLRDSISSIVSNDRSYTGSAVDTPGSSPASSVVMGPSSGKKGDSTTPSLNGSSRPSSILSSSTSRPSSKRNVSMPSDSTGRSRLPRNSLMSRSVTHSSSTMRGVSPCPGTHVSSSTPTPGNRTSRPGVNPLDGKPRWNSSPKIDYADIGHNFKALLHTTPPPQWKSSLPSRTPRTSSSYSSNIPLPSPLSREASSSPAPSHNPNSRRRLSSAPQSSSALRNRRGTSPAPAAPSTVSIDIPRARPHAQSSVSTLPLRPSTRRHSFVPDSTPEVQEPDTHQMPEDSPSTRPRPSRPATAMASGRRSSMLPQPKTPAATGRDSVARMGNGPRAGAGEIVVAGKGEEKM
ncbi:hypothetical protein MMC24_002066 [Lignoscripta atroalba]|nr:hypothetical protein [Lignoscripta atroalba]